MAVRAPIVTFTKAVGYTHVHTSRAAISSDFRRQRATESQARFLALTAPCLVASACNYQASNRCTAPLCTAPAPHPAQKLASSGSSPKPGPASPFARSQSFPLRTLAFPPVYDPVYYVCTVVPVLDGQYTILLLTPRLPAHRRGLPSITAAARFIPSRQPSTTHPPSSASPPAASRLLLPFHPRRLPPTEPSSILPYPPPHPNIHPE